MKRVTMLAFVLLLLAALPAAAQSTPTTAEPTKTEQVIASIPSLQNIVDEIHQFEAKVENNKNELKNANLDLRALKMKYVAELELQIAAHQDNPEIVQVLTDELNKTKAEIETLNTTK